jgi:purine-cytosine permease-like protein
LPSQRRRTAAVIGFIVAAVVAGVLGALLEHATGQWWTRYAFLPVVVAALGVDVFRKRK